MTFFLKQVYWELSELAREYGQDYGGVLGAMTMGTYGAYRVRKQVEKKIAEEEEAKKRAPGRHHRSHRRGRGIGASSEDPPAYEETGLLSGDDYEFPPPYPPPGS